MAYTVSKSLRFGQLYGMHDVFSDRPIAEAATVNIRVHPATDARPATRAFAPFPHLASRLLSRSQANFPSLGSQSHAGHRSGQRRHRRFHRLLSGPRRPRRHGDRPPERPGAGNQLRQRGRGLAGLLRPVGGAGPDAEGHQVDDHEAFAAGHPPEAGPGPMVLVPETADERQRDQLPAQQEPDGPHRRIQPRLPEGAARRNRHHL